MPTGEEPPAEAGGTEISYAEFGRSFFEHAVTGERILGAARGLAGEEFTFGPIGVGPGRIAQVNATGLIGEPAIASHADELISFRLSIPVAIEFELDLVADRHRYSAEVVVGLTLRARAFAPLRVVVEIEPPGKDDIQVTVSSEALRSKVLQRVAGIEAELGRFAAKYVRRELEKPYISAARDVDIASRMEKAWKRDRLSG